VVGEHTWNHARLDRLPSARVAAEVDCTNQLLARLAGRCGWCAPDGAYDRGVVDRLAARGLQLILWTVDSRDWAHPGSTRSWPLWSASCERGRSSCSTMAAATALRTCANNVMRPG
jgi:peptidoglycan/xylan/chitin deacetylase (PgdA/CDA1 family)